MLATAQLRTLLWTTPLFKGLSERQFQRVEALADVRHLEAHEQLFAEGQPCQAIYCLVDGLIKLYVSGPPGRQKIVELIQPADTFAEAAMFSGQGYPVSARAAEPSTVIAVRAFELSQMLTRDPQIAGKVMAQLSRRLHQLIDVIRTLSLLDSEQKVAHYLLLHCPEDGDQPPAVRVPTNRSGLASLLGLSTETLSRVLTRLTRRGLVVVEDRYILILDRNGLVVLANGQDATTEH